MRNRNLFNSNCNGASQFWKGLHKVKHLFQWGAMFEVHNGEMVRFWQDVWLGNTPLRIRFPNLFKTCDNAEVRICECWNQGQWSLNFRRQFGDSERDEWSQLITDTENLELDPGKDVVRWALDKSGNFSTKSLYLS